MKFRGVIATAAILFAVAQAMAQTEKPLPPDWITTSNKPCKVWNPEPQPNESVTWSGLCKDGFASGKGILFWTEDGKPDVEFDGEYANGKRNGHGVIISPDGKRFEGDWVDDKLVTDARDSI
jgi:hypothetical protein